MEKKDEKMLFRSIINSLLCVSVYGLQAATEERLQHQPTTSLPELLSAARSSLDKASDSLLAAEASILNNER